MGRSKYIIIVVNLVSLVLCLIVISSMYQQDSSETKVTSNFLARFFAQNDSVTGAVVVPLEEPSEFGTEEFWVSADTSKYNYTRVTIIKVSDGSIMDLTYDGTSNSYDDATTNAALRIFANESAALDNIYCGLFYSDKTFTNYRFITPEGGNKLTTVSHGAGALNATCDVTMSTSEAVYPGIVYALISGDDTVSANDTLVRLNPATDGWLIGNTDNSDGGYDSNCCYFSGYYVVEGQTFCSFVGSVICNTGGGEVCPCNDTAIGGDPVYDSFDIDVLNGTGGFDVTVLEGFYPDTAGVGQSKNCTKDLDRIVVEARDTNDNFLGSNRTSMNDQVYVYTGGYTGLVEIYVNGIKTEETYVTGSDLDPPIVSLISPSDTSATNNVDIVFVCNASDSSVLSSMTLYHNISGTFASNETNSISGTEDETNFTITGFGEGVYLWNCLGTDSLANSGFAQDNYTFLVDLTAPAFDDSQTGPPPNSDFNQSINATQLTVCVNDTLINIASVTVTIGYDGVIEVNTMEVISETSGVTCFGYNLTNNTYPDDYNVTFNATDVAGNSNTTETNFTINDVDAPNVYDVSPEGGVNYSLGTVVNISANVSDLFYDNIDTVIANITWDATYEEVQLVYNPSTGLYEGNFSNTTDADSYNVVIVAVDNAGNANDTGTTYFNILDTQPPTFNTDQTQPQPGSQFNQSDELLLAVNVSENSTVVAIIGYDSTYETVNLTYNETTGLYEGIFTNTTYPGDYNITFNATDLSGNSGTTTTDFTIDDVDAPNVFDSAPTAGSNYSLGDVVNISANVSDPYFDNIASVIANVTWDSTYEEVQLVYNPTTGLYEGNFSNTFSAEQYNITIVATDNAGNVNDTGTTYFNILPDLIPPTFNTNQTQPQSDSQFNQSDPLPLAVNVSENSTVVAIIGYDSTYETVNLTYNETSGLYEGIFVNTDYPGDYNITFNATDLSGNSNTTTTNFTINDVDAPNVYDVAVPAPGTNYDLGTVVNISANVSDPYFDNIASVIANVTWDSTYEEVPLVYNPSTGLYEGNFSNTTVIDQYNITIVAVDNAGNTNDTGTTYFNIQDVTPPVFYTNQTGPVAGSEFNQSDELLLVVNVSENSTVVAIIGYDSTYETVNLTYNSTSGLYEGTFVNTNYPGDYNITFNATDLSGNSGTTETNFTIDDVTAPNVFDVAVPAEGTNYSLGDVVNISANVSDPYFDNIASVIANVTWDSTYEEVPLVYNPSTGLYEGNFSNTYSAEQYNITIVATDNAGNVNDTGTTYFNILPDTTPPVFYTNETGPATGSEFNQSEEVLLSVNVSENSTVVAIIGYDSTYETVNLTYNETTGLYEGIFTNTTYPDDYNITFNATDLNGNSNTTTTNFTINDVDAPNVYDVAVPAEGTNYDLGTVVNISANVSDPYFDNIASVIANVTWDSTYEEVPLVYNPSTGLYEGDFSNTTTADTYNITIVAVDNAGNTNDTGTTYFNILGDITPPVFYTNDTGPAAGSQFNQSDELLLAVNVSENSTVVAVIGYDSTYETVNLTYNSTSGLYEGIFTNTTYPGDYNITFNATDLSGNSNTTTTDFTINDVDAPNVFDIGPAAGTNYSSDTVVNISANVSDPYFDNIASVIANVTWDSTYEEVVLLYNPSTGLYEGTFNDTSAIDQYNITIVAVDNAGNTNDTFMTYFATYDGSPPTVTLRVPANGMVTNNIDVQFICNASDNDELANITFYNNISGNFTSVLAVNVSGPQNQTNFTDYSVAYGTYGWNCLATDSSGNSAFASENYTFTLSTTVEYADEIVLSTNRINYWDVSLEHTVDVLNRGSESVNVNITCDTDMDFVSGSGCSAITSNIIACTVGPGVSSTYTLLDSNSSVPEYTLSYCYVSDVERVGFGGSSMSGFSVSGLDNYTIINNVTFIRIKNQEIFHTLVEYGRGRGNYLYDTFGEGVAGSGHSGSGCNYLPSNTMFELSFLHKVLNIRQLFDNLTAPVYDATFYCSYPNRTIVREHQITSIITNGSGAYLGYEIPEISGAWERMGYVSMGFDVGEQQVGDILSVNCTNMTYYFPLASGYIVIDEDSLEFEVRKNEPFVASASTSSTVGNGTQEVLVTYNITNTEIYGIDDVVFEIEAPQYAAFIGTRSELWGTALDKYRFEKTQVGAGESIIVQLIARFDTSAAGAISNVDLSDGISIGYVTCWEINAYNPNEYIQSITGIGSAAVNMSVGASIIDLIGQLQLIDDVTALINSTVVSINSTVDNIEYMIDVINATTDETNVIAKLINETMTSLLNDSMTLFTNTQTILNDTTFIYEQLDCDGASDSPICDRVLELNNSINYIWTLTQELNYTAANLNVSLSDINVTGVNVTVNIDWTPVENLLYDIEEFLNCTNPSTQANESVCNRLDEMENTAAEMNNTIDTILSTSLYFNQSIFGDLTFQDILDSITNSTTDTSEVLEKLQELRRFDQEIVFLVTDSFGMQQQAKSDFEKGNLESATGELMDANLNLIQAVDKTIDAKKRLQEEGVELYNPSLIKSSLIWVLLPLIVVIAVVLYLFGSIRYERPWQVERDRGSFRKSMDYAGQQERQAGTESESDVYRQIAGVYKLMYAGNIAGARQEYSMIVKSYTRISVKGQVKIYPLLQELHDILSKMVK